MRRYNENDRIVLIKEGDRNYNKHGFIESIDEMIHVPMSIYYLKFDDGTKGYYFYGDLSHE